MPGAPNSTEQNYQTDILLSWLLLKAKNFICKRSHFMVKTGFKELKNVQMTENRVPGIGNFFYH